MIREQKKYFNWDTITSTSSNTSSAGSGTGNTQRSTSSSGNAISDSEFKTFINNLASKLGITLTPEKSRFFQAWRRAEGTNATYNPYATKWPGPNKTTWSKDPGMTQHNTVGVKRFSNIDAGVQATADTLNQSYYTNLMGQLKQDNITADELAVNPNLRTWGTNASNPNLIKSVLKAPSAADNMDIEPQTNLFDELIRMNTQVKNIWRNWYGVFVLEPENYLGIFSSWYDDKEEEAADWIRNEFYNISNHAKLLDQYEIWCNNNLATLPDCKWVLKNIRNIRDIIIPGIVDLISRGRQGSIKPEYSTLWLYDPKQKKWISVLLRFRWNYF
jgi:hypothetical protein